MPEPELEAAPAGPVEVYEPLEPEEPGPPVEAPSAESDAELDARAPSVMPMVWTVLGACGVALCLAFVFMASDPPRKAPVYQAATPAERGPT